MKILVCDDDETVVKMILFSLNKDNLTDIIVAKDGLRAIEQLGNQQFDLVITDIHMPNQSGDHVLNFIRQDQKRDTPIIMLSSDNEEEIVSMALKQGVNEFLKKPLKSNELSKVVKRLLRL